MDVKVVQVGEEGTLDTQSAWAWPTSSHRRVDVWGTKFIPHLGRLGWFGRCGCCDFPPQRLVNCSVSSNKTPTLRRFQEFSCHFDGIAVNVYSLSKYVKTDIMWLTRNKNGEHFSCQLARMKKNPKENGSATPSPSSHPPQLVSQFPNNETCNLLPLHPHCKLVS